MISREETERIGSLARLELTGEEIDRIRCDLGRILEFVEALDELEIPDVPAGEVVVPPRPRWREDEVIEYREKNLTDLAPVRRDQFYEVPIVIEGEE